ncbi:MAG: methyltransferase [Myxococcales bacterium]|nr:methyltransferase [Myxococcales bacterium]
MPEHSRDGYDSVPFRGRPIPWASPAALSATSVAHGGPALGPGPVRVLELGCGDGAHLIPLAWFRPELTAVGLDTSARAIERARAASEALGLADRLAFETRDLADHEAGGFDVVVAQGVYSWIDAGQRAALRRVAAAALRPGGLCYVSFNSEPGWSIRGRIRDALVRDRPGSVDEARARLAGLRALLGEPADAWSYLLAHELERGAAAEEGYLVHEYLAEDNASFWLGDVVRDFAAEGLAYVGDATFDRLEGHVDPLLRTQARALGGDRVAEEERIDLIAFRQLHAAVFAKVEALDAPPARSALVHRAWIAGAVARRNDPFDLADGVEEVFDGPKGRELRIRDATLKVALLLLADRYPAGTRLEALHAECAARLAPHGIAASSVEALADRIGTLHEEMQVELRLEDARLRVPVGERPRVLPLTRHEAATRDVLTAPTHQMIPVEPIDRAIVERLDGTRTLDALAEALSEDIAAGRVPLEGAPSIAERVRPVVEARLASTVATLGWWGLLA